ncbi:MAG TPA: TIGR03790 family protein, partial [Burkholderiaceae bacterium]
MLRWQPVPRLRGRLRAADLVVVINTADPYSVAVGEYYASRRAIPDKHVLRITLPVKPVLNLLEFEPLRTRLAELGPEVQALALAWREPYAVNCNSITAALTMGYQAEMCQNTCGLTRPSPYLNVTNEKPFDAAGMRLSMLLAARTVESAQKLIDRGIEADNSAGYPRLLARNAVYVDNDADRVRNVRHVMFPPAGPSPRQGLNVILAKPDDAPV